MCEGKRASRLLIYYLYIIGILLEQNVNSFDKYGENISIHFKMCALDWKKVFDDRSLIV